MFKIHADEMLYRYLNEQYRNELCDKEIKWNLELQQEIFDPIDWNSGPLTLKKVIFNPPATIAFWADGTKTVVKCMAGDIYDPYAGLALCYSKKLLGRQFHKTFRKYCASYEEVTYDE